METKIDETGLLGWVYLESVTGSTPSLAQLQTHDAVFVYSGEPFDDPDLMGDRLADYVDGGGSLVLAGAAYDPLLGLGIAGRLVSDGYLPFQMRLPTQAAFLTLVEDLPDHTLLKGVNSFNGGLMSLHHTTSLVAGTTQVASWSNNQPLIVYWTPAGAGSVIGLNMGPQRSLLCEASNVIVMMDGDPAGRRAATRTRHALRNDVDTAVINLLDGLDPDDLTDSEIARFLGRDLPF